MRLGRKTEPFKECRRKHSLRLGYRKEKENLGKPAAGGELQGRAGGRSALSAGPTRPRAAATAVPLSVPPSSPPSPVRPRDIVPADGIRVGVMPAISGCASRGQEGALGLFFPLPHGWPEREGRGWAAFPAPHGRAPPMPTDRRPQEPATARARPCHSVCAHVLTRTPCQKPQQFPIQGGAREAGKHYCSKQEQVNGDQPTPALPFSTGTGCDRKARGRKGIVVLACRGSGNARMNRYRWEVGSAPGAGREAGGRAPRARQTGTALPTPGDHVSVLQRVQLDD